MTDQVELATGLATSVQQGPDGQPWVSLHIQTALLQCAWMMPPDSADGLADSLPLLLREVAEKARQSAKLQSGIVTAHTMQEATFADRVNTILKGNNTP